MAHRHVELGLRLPQLQNLMKRDPSAYHDDFQRQYRHFQSELQIFLLKPSQSSARFAELVTFLGHVSACYPEEAAAFPEQLASLLERHGPALDQELRRTLVQSLILLRNRELYEAVALVRLAFRLFRIPDKALRKLLKEHITSDLRNANHKRRDETLNRKVQGLVDQMLSSNAEGDVAAKKGLDIAVDLYRRRIWTDARTVNIIGRALLHPKPRVFVTAHNFFLGIDRIMADDEEEEERDEAEAAGLRTSGATIDRRTGGVTIHQHSKKTAKRQRAQDGVKRKIRVARRKLLSEKDAAPEPRFPALTLLNDPQGLAEQLFRRLRSSRDKFKTRLLMMNLLSRLVGHHKLLVLSLYPFLQRYITGHQQEVTHVLAFLVQATHDLVPPEELMPATKAVANAFVADRCPPEAVAVGINTLRELIVRAPALLSEEGMDDFCQDIAAYGRNRDRSVTTAARGFLNAVRSMHPALLKRKDRGKFHNPNARPSAYGTTRVLSSIPGAALLALEQEGFITVDDDEELVVAMESEDETSRDGEEADDDGDEDEDEDELGAGGRVEVHESRKGEGDGGAAFQGGSETEIAGGSRGAARARRAAQASGQASGDGVAALAVGEPEEAAAASDAAEAEAGTSATEAEAGDSDSGSDGGVVPVLLPIPPAHEALAPGATSLSGEDFERIAMLKDKVLAKLQEPAFRTKCERRGRGEFERLLSAVEGTDLMAAYTGDSDEEPDGVAVASGAVEAADLAGLAVKRRKTLEERLESVLRGRADKFESRGHAGGLTNREKQRKKNFLMVRKGRSMAQKLQNAARLVRKRQDGNAKKVMDRDKRKRRRT